LEESSAALPKRAEQHVDPRAWLADVLVPMADHPANALLRLEPTMIETMMSSADHFPNTRRPNSRTIARP
jgi:hypothetical protein